MLHQDISRVAAREIIRRRGSSGTVSSRRPSAAECHEEISITLTTLLIIELIDASHDGNAYHENARLAKAAYTSFVA